MPQAHYDDHGVTIYHGDCLEVLRDLPDASIDAVVTDPPYGLEFMGKEWDRFSGDVTDRNFKGFVLSQQRTRNVKCPECGKWAYDHPGRLCECGGVRRAQVSTFQQWCDIWVAECLRVLKPGGHMVVFGGTRTYHRLACAIEDAGFEIRDCLMWLYGSGMPKGLDVAKAIDKAERGVPQGGTDPTSPNHGRYQSMGNVGKRWDGDAGRGYGAGGSQYLADGGPWDGSDLPRSEDALQWQGWNTSLRPSYEPIVLARKPLDGTVVANVLAHGTGAINVDATRIAADNRPARVIDPKQTDNTVYAGRLNDSLLGGSRAVGTTSLGRWPANVALDEEAAAMLDEQSGERSAGGKVVGTEPSRTGQNGIYGTFGRVENAPYEDTGGASRFFYTSKANRGERPEVGGIRHVTVKPLNLMEWLVRMVTPPNGVVLDLFAGSGTTAEACVTQDFRCIAIEREAEYLPLIVSRVTRQRDPVAHVKLVGDANPTLFDDL